MALFSIFCKLLPFPILLFCTPGAQDIGVPLRSKHAACFYHRGCCITRISVGMLSTCRANLYLTDHQQQERHCQLLVTWCKPPWCRVW